MTTPADSAGRGSRIPEAVHRRRWAILGVLILSLLIVVLDNSILNVAIKTISTPAPTGLGATQSELEWAINAYTLVFAGLLFTAGLIGDRIGRKKVLLGGLVVFGLGSALAAESGSPGELIAYRALMALGAAFVMPATLAVLMNVFEREEQPRAIGIWAGGVGLAIAIGPITGGLLLDHFWWGSVFLVNIPLMLVSLPVGRLLLPESTGDRDGPWDVVGAMLAAVGLFGVVLGVKRLGGGEALSVLTVVPLVAGAALLVVFVRRQRRLPHPLVDLRMFARPAFSTSVGCIVLAMLALVGLELIAAQYLQLVLELSPLQTGLRLLPLTFAAMAAGLAGSRMLRRFGPRRMVSAGFCLTAGAVVVLTAMGGQDDPGLLLFGFVLLGFGLETTLFGAYESMLSEAPPEQAGGAAAIGETSYQLGAGMGIALLGTVMNAAYAPGLAEVPGVPASASGAASHSLGEAYGVAARLGGAAGGALRRAARDSFVHGLHVTLLVSAGLLLLGAVMALRLPRTMQCETPPVELPAQRGAERSRVSA